MLSELNRRPATGEDVPFLADRPRRWGTVFAVVWLGFLVKPIGVSLRRDDLRGWVCVVLLLAFCATYVVHFWNFRGPTAASGGPYLARIRGRAIAVMVVITVLLGLLAGPLCVSTLPFLTVSVVVADVRVAPYVVLTLAGLGELAARLIPGWEDERGIGFAVLGAGMAMWGVMTMAERNLESLRTTRAESEARLAEERTRFSRDLHDILGHSLTVITLKAEVAGRLLDVDVDRARAELQELERISREALVDVRSAVEGYRGISLTGELARARQVLAAAGVRAELPGSAEQVSADLRGLFAWAVREAVTNVVRHAGATSCRVTLTPTSVVIEDDGRGMQASRAEHEGTGYTPGTGLTGLRERAAAAGAVVTVEPAPRRGCRITVSAKDALPGPAEPNHAKAATAATKG